MDQGLLFIIVSSTIYLLSYIVRITTLIKFKNNKKLLYVLLKLIPFIILIFILFVGIENNIFKIDSLYLFGIGLINPTILAVITFFGELIIEIKT